MKRPRSLSAASIRTRLVVIVVLFAIGIAALAVLASTRMEGRIHTERKDATRSVVQTALGVLTYYGQEEEAGRLTRASRATRSELESIRAAAHDLAATSRQLQETVG